MVTPGDQLIIEVSIVARKKTVLKVEAKVLVENQIASSAEIILITKSL